MPPHTPRKPGIFIWFGYRMPVPERARLIRETGFETVLQSWDDSFTQEEGMSREAQTDAIRNEGLYIENAHVQFSHVNDLWLDTLDGQALLESYLSDIDGIAACEIPVAVFHTTNGFNPPPPTEIGLNRFRILAERADKSAVRIALENVRNNHNLQRILDTTDSSALGFCYDAGHDLIWSERPHELLTRYGDRLFAVHLHDNLGLGDDHLAPGTGKVDWRAVREGIAASSYRGSLTLEGDSSEIPQSRSPREHLRMFFEGAISVFKD